MKFILILLMAVSSFAAAQSAPELSQNRWRVGIAAEMLGTESINQENLEWLPSWGAEVGYEFGRFVVLVEGRFWQDSSQSGALSIRQKSRQGLLWVRGHKRLYQGTLGLLQLGTGYRQTKIENQLGGERMDLNGDSEMVLGAGGGFGWQLGDRWRSEVVLKALKTQTRLPWEISASLALQFLL
ncbi:MAG: hypothetical protein AB7N80_00300 [Bdellovibrionales bacterium]